MLLYKEMNKVQKILSLFCVILLLIGLIETNILNMFKEPVVYTEREVVPEGENYGVVDGASAEFSSDKDMLEILRIVLDEIPDQGSMSITISNGEELLYQGTKAFSQMEAEQWVEFKTMLPIREGETYRIEFSVSGNQSPQMVYKDLDGGGEPFISYGYSENLRVIDKILCSTYLIILCFIAIAIIVNINKIYEMFKQKVSGHLFKTSNITMVSIIMMGLSILSIISSGLEISPIFMILFPFATFLCTNWIINSCSDIKEIWQETSKKVILILLSFLGAFCLVGSRCFIYPLDKNVMIGAILTFLITVVWICPIIVWGIISIDRFSAKLTCEKISPAILAAVAIMIILGGGIYFVRAFNPAISSPDTTYCMNQAISSVTGLTDWHPPFYIMWLRAILKLVPSIYAVVFVQYIFFAYVFVRGLILLYKRGLSFGLLVVFTLLTVLNCSNMVTLTTIWKDIPYTLCLLWLTVLAVELVLNEKHSWFLYAEVIVALVGTCFFRQNGIVPYLLLSVCLVACFRKKWKVWVSVIAAFGLILFIRFPVYDYFEVQRDPNGGEYIGLGQDILGVYYNGGTLPEEALEIVRVLSKGDMESYEYSPYYSQASYDLDIKKTDFIKAYIKTFIKTRSL